MQYVVPQFIEVESKVIGPISVRQFIILLATAGIMFIWYSLFSTVFFIILAAITFAIGVVFAFVKVNSQPFHQFILSVIQTLKRPALALWQREINQTVVVKMARKDKKSDKADGPFTPKPDISKAHFAELSLIVDTAGQYSPEDLERLRQEQTAQTPQVTPPNKESK
ncbi:MAG: hypothetical protein ACD_43C00068G0005 [uncultured bacterium]|nr:MAG: hypothetical protein ACD_43C00068G0005 [uncultured bacterium]